jgi:ribosomal protein S18 acetylase RimI-like enzyme
VTIHIERVDDLARLADDNAAVWWAGLAAVRGNAMIRKSGYFWVPGSLRAGLRIMILRPDLEPGEIAEIMDLARSWPAGSRVTVEDPHSVIDLRAIGFEARQLPVMAREPGPVTGTRRVTVSRVTTPEEAAIVERVVVDGFPLRQFLPYRVGEAVPFSLAQRPGVAFYLARRDGEPAGACMTMHDGAAAGIYWVGTLPEHRSHGVGRAVMTAALNDIRDVPATLTATAAGLALYESLGFRTVAEATWWWSALRT